MVSQLIYLWVTSRACILTSTLQPLILITFLCFSTWNMKIYQILQTTRGICGLNLSKVPHISKVESEIIVRYVNRHKTGNWKWITSYFELRHKMNIQFILLFLESPLLYPVCRTKSLCQLHDQLHISISNALHRCAVSRGNENVTFSQMYFLDLSLIVLSS